MILRLLLSTVFFATLFIGHSSAQFIQNQGQWPDQVEYKMELSNGAIWFERDGWWISMLHEGDLEQFHDLMHGHEGDGESVDHVDDFSVRGHAVRMQFEGTSSATTIEPEDKQLAYHNYFIGSDRDRWAGEVPLFGRLVYRDLYPGIDAEVVIVEGRAKVTYIVAPGADESQIKWRYISDDELEVKSDEIIVHTSVGDLVETALFCEEVLEEGRIEKTSAFSMHQGSISVRVDDRNPTKQLLIDPILVASTNSGSTASCYGHTATFDNPGNIYAAGRCFNVGYPTNSGSFQMNFAGGGVDMCISKYNPDGSSLIYSTYLGGSQQDLPHSMYVNSQNLLHVFGTTASSDFPVTANAYDTSFNGGNDMIVTIFTASGSSLVGSTFIGGSSSDGVNGIPSNYGDNFRGEIVVDGYNYIYVAAMTSSEDFPVVGNGVFQDTLSGLQDGVVFKLNYNASQMEWSTYLGGPLNDVAYGIKLDESLNAYVSGSTQGGFPVDSNGGGAHPTYLGGDYDGFIVRLKHDATEVEYSSYYGTDQKDQNFFVQVDQQGDVYLFGQSNGTLASSTGKYQGPGTLGSYIYKTSAELDTVYWVTAFGNMAPTAFLVDLCSHIYACGHGGLGTLSTTSFDTVAPVLNVSGAGFYLMALSPDASTLEFGSFFGNSGSHVDGGTSRFDKRGFVYEATCSGGAFTTTSWAYSPNNAAGGYDVTVFKIDFEVDGVVAYAGASPGNFGCVPFTVDFNNIGSTGQFHFWDFGDGDTSNDSLPTHTYTTPGTYTVLYVSSDSVGCNLVDSAYLIITVQDSVPPTISWEGDCADSVYLTVETEYSDVLWETGATTNSIWVDTNDWFTVEVTNTCGTFIDSVLVDFHKAFLFSLPSDTAICDPSYLLPGPGNAAVYTWSTGDTTAAINIPSAGYYSLTASDGFCSDTDSVYIDVSYILFSTSDSVICEDSVTLAVASSIGTIQWSTGDTNDQVTFYSDGTYWVHVQNGFCARTDTINLLFSPLEVTLPNDTSICSELSVTATASEPSAFTWSNGFTGNPALISIPGTYWVEAFNGNCTASDTIEVNVIPYVPYTEGLQHFCDTLSTTLYVFPQAGSTFLWSDGDTTHAKFVDESGLYTVTMTYGGCQWIDTFDVFFGRTPDLSVVQDREICAGDTYRISLDTTYATYLWSDATDRSFATFTDSGSHWVRVMDGGCERIQPFHISFKDPSKIVAHEVPNVITPNSDGINDALDIDIRDYTVFTEWQIDVYNRWGHRVFQSKAPTISWDGATQSGEALPSGVYYYLIEGNTICIDKENVQYRGAIHVLR